MKILMLGLNDPAGMMIAFANAINRYSEHTARVVSIRSVYRMNYEYDIELARIRDDDFGEIEYLLDTSDIFHFHMLMDESYQIGPFLVKDHIAGKALVHHHHGTYDHQQFLGSYEQYREKYKNNSRKVLVSTPDLLSYLPMADWQPNLVPLWEADFLPREDHLLSQKLIRVVQAPTRKWHKHTSEFESVATRLSSSLPMIDFQVLEDLSYRECLKEKRRAHIVFDHMNGWFGISSLESLSQAVPVIAGLDDVCINHIRKFTGVSELPWVIARDEAGLESEIRRLVHEPDMRAEIGAQSRAFMESYWNEQRVLDELFRIYGQL